MVKNLEFNGWTYYTGIEYISKETSSIIELHFRIDISGRVELLDKELFLDLLYEKYHELDKLALDKFLTPTYNCTLEVKLKSHQYKIKTQ